MQLPNYGIKNYMLNFGPQHPAAHGVLRLILELNGEVIERADPHIGLLHRGTEKLCENKTLLQILPYFDRLDYISMMSQEHASALIMEQILKYPVTTIVQYIRVIFAELTRILNHLMAITSHAMDVGALTPFLWCFEEREKILEFYERVSGARLHAAFIRPGGISQSIPLGLIEDILQFTQQFFQRLIEIQELLHSNRIWKQRLVDIGIITAKEALSYGFSGPMLRASGISWDIRKTIPYDTYNLLTFEIPIGQNADCYDRYLIRMEEMKQSTFLISQALLIITHYAFHYLKQKHYKKFLKFSMEFLINHFKFWTEGFLLSQKEIYLITEAPKGELGIYLKNSINHKRLHIKSPGYLHLQGIDLISRGHLLADVVTIIGALDLVFGEIDR